VRSGQSIEKIFNFIGSSTMFAPFPATSSVSFSMCFLTSLKSEYFLPSLSFSKIAYGFPYALPTSSNMYLDLNALNEAQEDVLLQHQNLEVENRDRQYFPKVNSSH